MDRTSVQYHLTRLKYLKSIGCCGWFRHPALTPPVLPRMQMCIRCSHKRSAKSGQLCSECRHSVLYADHPIGRTSCDEEYELRELAGPNGLPRQRRTAVSRGRDPLAADLLYHGTN